MKSLLVKLGVIFIGLALFTYAEVWGADWKFYAVSKEYLDYYDAQSITRPSKNIVRVWIKSDYMEKGVMDMVEKLGKKYENLSHRISLSETNCAEKTIRCLSLTDYDNKGGVIFIHSDPSSKWYFIIPESMGEAFYKEVCK